MGKKKHTYGKENVLSEADFKDPKIRITMMVDEDIIRIFKDRAAKAGVGYQTLMNRALRESAGLVKTLEERVRKLELKILSG